MVFEHLFKEFELSRAIRTDNGVPFAPPAPSTTSASSPCGGLRLAIALERNAPGHPDVGQALNNLATNYEKQDRHAESEALTRRALAIYQKIPGAEPAVATLLNNLGQITKAEGRYADAEPPIKQSRGTDNGPPRP